MGTLGASDISCCITLYPRWKGNGSLVAFFVIGSPVRNLFLYGAERVKSAMGAASEEKCGTGG